MTRLHPTAPVTGSRSARYRRPGGPWDVPSLDAGLATALRRAAAGASLVDGSLRLTSAEVEGRVAAVAGGLRSSGVRRGDVVAWQRPNGWETHVLFRACWRLGAVAAPVHHAASSSDVAVMLDQVSPTVVVGEELPSGRPFERSVSRGSDLAVALFTSGSTGRPKAVLHTGRGLLSKARTMAMIHGLTNQDVVLMPAPAAHISGLLNGVLVPGVAGMRTVWMAKWDPSAAVDLIESEGVSFMIGPPTFFVSLMTAPDFSSSRVRSLRLVSSGGAGVTPAFVAEATSVLGARVKRTYGSTEAPTVTTSGSDDPVDRASSTDGRPTGEVEVRISDPTSGRARPTGERGEVWVRGPELFVGYADRHTTQEAFARGGWFRTGDLGVLDDEGWLTIVGRIKDIIIRGGENISAAEVEAVLEAHPAIRQAAAIGYPDERMGERVCAFVVATAPFGLDECRRWFESRGVTKFKRPERVVQLEGLPLLGAGKIDRAALRRLAANDAGGLGE